MIIHTLRATKPLVNSPLVPGASLSGSLDKARRRLDLSTYLKDGTRITLTRAEYEVLRDWFENTSAAPLVAWPEEKPKHALAYALEVEKAETGYRALLWDIDNDEPRQGRLLVDILETDASAHEAASLMANRATAENKIITYAKSGDRIEAPDEISVVEAACAMAGLW